MNLLTKLSNAFTKAIEEVTLEQAKLADGTVIEADAFEVGQAAFVPTEDGEAIPLPAGSYELDGGITIQVDEMGVITDVAETAAANAEEEAPEAEAEATPEMANENVAAPVAKKVIESQVKETVFSKVDLTEAIEKVKVEMSESITNLEKEVAELKLERDTLQERLDNEPAAAKLNRSPEGGRAKTSGEALAKMPNTQKSRILQRIQNI